MTRTGWTEIAERAEDALLQDEGAKHHPEGFSGLDDLAIPEVLAAMEGAVLAVNKVLDDRAELVKLIGPGKVFEMEKTRDELEASLRQLSLVHAENERRAKEG
jgi:hypothetical protein